MTLSHADLLKIFRFMLLERRFEEKTIEMSHAGAKCGDLLSSIGYEAVNAGAFYEFRPDDYVKLHYRNRGAWFQLGLTPRAMMAEVLGKKASSTKGKSNYLHPVTGNTIQRTGIIGSSEPVASGAALVLKWKKKNQIVLCAFGEGSTHEGDWHEGVNFAALWNLPILFLCLNNRVSQTVPYSDTTPVKNVADRFKPYGIDGVHIHGIDPVLVHGTVQKAIKKIRDGDGPRFIDCEVPRLRPHDEGLDETRSKEEMKKLEAKDPVKLFKKQLMKNKVLTQKIYERMENEIRSEIDDAAHFAEECPYAKSEEVFTDVYAPSGATGPFADMSPVEGRSLTFREALKEALVEEMQRDEKMFILGADVRRIGLGDVAGLAAEFGNERVRDTTISESGTIGLSVGAAILGYRPVVEISSSDWMGVAMDQVANSAAKMRYSYGGKASVPMVVRIRTGAIPNAQPMYHCQSFEAWFSHIPGIKVVYPSTPYEAKGLLKASIRDDNPVLYLEHRLLYNSKGHVPEGEYLIPLGKGKVKREGNDVTVVAYGYHVHEALAAAEQLAQEGISVEVVDPRTLQPLDKDLILNSVRKTGRAVVVHEAHKTGGLGGEIASLIAEESFTNLKAPIKRLGAPFTPSPFTYGLKKHWLSFMDKDAIKDACKQTVAYTQ